MPVKKCSAYILLVDTHSRDLLGLGGLTYRNIAVAQPANSMMTQWDSLLNSFTVSVSHEFWIRMPLAYMIAPPEAKKNDWKNMIWSALRKRMHHGNTDNQNNFLPRLIVLRTLSYKPIATLNTTRATAAMPTNPFTKAILKSSWHCPTLVGLRQNGGVDKVLKQGKQFF